MILFRGGWEESTGGLLLGNIGNIKDAGLLFVQHSLPTQWYWDTKRLKDLGTLGANLNRERPPMLLVLVGTCHDFILGVRDSR